MTEREDEVTRLARPRRGHFDLGTGYHGDLWLDLDALFLRPALVRPHARWLAGRLADHRIDAVCGPLAGGAFLAQTVADLMRVAFLPAYPASAAGPRETAGYRLARTARDLVGGWRVGIVDDAVNAGTATRACFEHLRDLGAVPVAAGALLALGQASAMVAATMSLPFYTVATAASRVWPAGDCELCADGVPLTVPSSGG
jgi:orotate phosphoribosyltransferase